MGHAQQIVDDKYLSIRFDAGPYPNGWNGKLLGYFFGQGGGNFFEHQGKTAEFFEHF